MNCCIKLAKLIACNIPICIFHWVNRNGNKALHVLAGWSLKFFLFGPFVLSLVQRILWKYILRNCDLCLLQSVPSCISLWLKYFLLIIQKKKQFYIVARFKGFCRTQYLTRVTLNLRNRIFSLQKRGKIIVLILFE